MKHAEINQYVQTCLRDYRISPWKRAKMAANAIESHVRADTGYEEGPLPIPLEWEHRVPADDDVIHVEVDPAFEPTIITDAKILYASLDPEPDVEIAELVEMEVAAAEAEDAVSEALMREAFNAEFNGRKDQANEAFDAYWNRGMP